MIMGEEQKEYFKRLGYNKFIENEKVICIVDTKIRSGKAINITKHDKGVRKEDNLGMSQKMYQKEIVGVYDLIRRMK